MFLKTFTLLVLASEICAGEIPNDPTIRPGSSWANIAWGHHDGGRDDVVKAEVVLLDLQDVTPRGVQAFKAQGKKIICYMSAGTVEEFRGYYKANRPAWDMLTLSPMDEWYGERWLDIRRASRLIPLFKPVLADMARAGCDAVEFDNMDCYGSPDCAGHLGMLSHNEMVEFNVNFVLELTNIAHELSMGVFCKNAAELHPEVIPYMQGLIVENCARFKECAGLSMWTAFNKPVFAVDYMRPHADYNRDPCAGYPATVMVKHCISDSKGSLCVDPWINCIEKVSIGDPIVELEDERTDI